MDKTVTVQTSIEGFRPILMATHFFAEIIRMGKYVLMVGESRMNECIINVRVVVRCRKENTDGPSYCSCYMAAYN